MTGLSIATRVTATLSAAAIIALAIAANRAGEGAAVAYRDAERAARQNQLLGTMVPARGATAIDWLSPRLLRAVCGRTAGWLRTQGCAARLLSLSEAVEQANAALRALGPPARGRANHVLTTVYAIDGERMLALLDGGSVSALMAARELRLMARTDRQGSQPFAGVTWREHTTGRVQQARFPAGAIAHMETAAAARTNPWAPFSGCAYAQEAGPGYVDTHVLRHEGAPAHCLLPPGKHVTVDAMAMPPGWPSIAPQLVAVVNAAPQNPNRVPVYGRDVPQGVHAVSTIVREAQDVTQAVADCFTARADACKHMGIDPGTWRTRYESAAVRRIGILVMDVETGDIEAAASAHTTCYAQQHDGPGVDAYCPQLPAQPARRGSLLANHALFGEAMPGSLVKPITALALLGDPVYGAHLLGPGRERLQRDIAESNSKSFHDRLFCSDKRFEGCARPRLFAEAAARLGWNEGCEAGAPQRCATASLVTGSTKGGLTGFIGRAGIREQARNEGAWEDIPPDFSPQWAKACAQDGWSKCKGGPGSAVDLLADAWGQGNARATPPGIARMFGALGAAANGAKQAASPHLLYGALPARAGLNDTSYHRALAIKPRHAALVVGGMSLGHRRGGTSASACTAVTGATECNAIDWVAGKTATPVFNHDRLTLSQRLQTCGDVLHRRAQRPQDRERAFHCGASPVKWYAALVKTSRSTGAGWSKIVVVSVERNWDRATGLVDSPGDTGVNIAARAAFESIQRLY